MPETTLGDLEPIACTDITWNSPPAKAVIPAKIVIERAVKLPRERESEIQRSIVMRLGHRFGITLFRRNVGAMTDSYGHHVRFAAPGQADLWGFDRTAKHWEIETKRPGNRPTDAQLKWLKYMSNLGCVAFWADSANIAERVAEAVLRGGVIVWHNDDAFDVEV